MPESALSSATTPSPQSIHIQGKLVFRDRSIRLFLLATVFWGIVTSVTSILSGLLLSMPRLFENVDGPLQPFLTFARFDSMRANLAIFAFGANAIFGGIYYSIQRLCKAPLWSSSLAVLHFVSWQAVLVALLACQWTGYVQGRSLSGGLWPIDIAIAIVWICFFGFNCAMTIAHRRERHLYVSIWFYLSCIVAVGFLQIANLVVLPIDWIRSVPLLTGTQDAWVGNWYKQSMIAFLLTMPFVGLMYYFLPKAADRPLYSYKLTIVHFWSLLVLLLCSTSNQLHYTTIPEWASTLGMLSGILLWMPSWAMLVNGICTLSGAWFKLRHDPALRFLVAGLFVFGFSTLESAVLAIKSVHALVHYSDWELAHWDTMTLGWIGMTTFGMIYWLMPRMVACNLGRFSNFHFWLAIAGLILTVVPEYAAGFVQARKWSQLTEMGKLQYSFMETLQSVSGLWWVRLVGGIVYLLGTLGLAINMLLLLRAKTLLSITSQPPEWTRGERDAEASPVLSSLVGKPVLEIAAKLDQFAMLQWHRKLERQPIRFVLLIGLTVVALSLMQAIPIWVSRWYQPPIASVQPYTPLELIGREIYIAQGCQNCHSQMVRPLVYESQRYGAISQAGEFEYDRPSLWGEHRVGPDLAREGGGRQSSFWHWRHFESPPTMTAETVMPAFEHLLSTRLSFTEIDKQVQVLSNLGAPNTAEVADGDAFQIKIGKMAQRQAEATAAEIISQGGPVSYQGNLIKDTSAIALIAYIQRLGTDLSRPVPTNSLIENKTN